MQNDKIIVIGVRTTSFRCRRLALGFARVCAVGNGPHRAAPLWTSPCLHNQVECDSGPESHLAHLPF